jgi:uncharacterized protein YjdB
MFNTAPQPDVVNGVVLNHHRLIKKNKQMNKAISKLTIIALLLSAFAFVGCSDNESDSLLPVVTSIRVTNATDGVITLIQQDTKQVEVGFYPPEATDISDFTFRFTSSNADIFTVDANGVVTAIGVGEAVLRVEAVNNSNIWTLVVISVDERIFPVTSIYIPEEYRIVYIETDASFDLGSVITVYPENASNPEVIFISGNEYLAFVNDLGVIHTREWLGNVTITVRATDGSNVEETVELRIREVGRTFLDRTGWSVEVSAAHTPINIINGTQTDAFGGFPHLMIDGSTRNGNIGDIGAIIVKPGRTFGGITAPTDYPYFIVYMGANRDFNFVSIRHRRDNSTANLRVAGISVWGSNNGSDFTELLEDADVPVRAGVADVDAAIDLPGTFNYRYVKVYITRYGLAAGNTIQISDFNVGTSIWLDLD